MLGNGIFLTGSGSGEAMDSIITNIGKFVTGAVDWIGDFAGAITSSEILTLGVVIVPLAGFGIGCIKRLLNQKV